MPDFLMETEKHEALLNELLDGEIEQSRKTEILQELRNSHNAVVEGVNELSQTNEKLTKNNDDLVTSNSQLFRQLGIVGADDESSKNMQEQDKSETITLEEII